MFFFSPPSPQQRPWLAGMASNSPRRSRKRIVGGQSDSCCKWETHPHGQIHQGPRDVITPSLAWCVCWRWAGHRSLWCPDVGGAQKRTQEAVGSYAWAVAGAGEATAAVAAATLVVPGTSRKGREWGRKKKCTFKQTRLCVITLNSLGVLSPVGCIV